MKMTLRELVDKYDEVRLARLAADKVAQALKEQETALKHQLIARLAEENLTSVGGTHNSFAMKTSTVAHATDWTKVYDYVLETGEFDLLYRRLNSAAVLDRLENGVEVPGTTVIELHDLSRSKV